MKKKTWLLIIVLIVFVINISFFVLVRMAKVDKVVQTRITDQLSERLNAVIEMEGFTFNDKQANISGIKISSPGKYELKVSQLYVEYNLIKLIFSKFENLKAISHIKIYDPEFSLRIVPDGERTEKSEFIIPDIAEFFKMLNIYNGTLNIEFENESVKIANSWKKIDLTIKNTKNSDITISASSGTGSDLLGSCILNNGSIEKAELKLNDLKPSKLEITQLNSLEFLLDADVSYSDDKLKYSANIKNINAGFAEKKASIDSILISGDSDRTFITLHDTYLDGNKIDGNAIINDVLSDKRT
ncbi:MAG: hypothetical protein HQ554_00485, partial [FCB group bacterium]|nr:hypothetical protein [FCB group bacterium]